MGFVFFLFGCTILGLLFWAMILATKCKNQKSQIDVLTKDRQSDMAEMVVKNTNIKILEHKLKTANDQLNAKVAETTVVAEPVAPCKTCMTGVVLKCGINECVVRWENGKYERMAREKVHQLILSGVLHIGPKANLHGPAA